MNGSGDIGGRIRVVLHPAGSRIGRVEIISTRPVDAARIFEGRPVDEMLGQIGRIFSLCGKAQSIAALRAAETALGLSPAPGVEAARELLRRAEMFTQIAMRLALHWPQTLGLPLQPEVVRAGLAAEAAFEATVAGPDWRRLGAGIGRPPAEAGAPLMVLEQALAASSFVEDLTRALKERGLEAYGALPEGAAPEAGALARHWDAPAVAGVRAAHGAGLAARLAASAEDLRILPGEMRAALAAVTPAEPRAPARRSGAGEAIVETARGPLFHRLELRDGRVHRCRTFAPTEANFAPDGPLALGLTGAALDPLAAGLALLAIDPCVAADLEVADA